MKVYIDTNDWWLGYYRGPNHHYVCPFFTVVIRWDRKPKPFEPELDIPATVAMIRADNPALADAITEHNLGSTAHEPRDSGSTP